MKPPAVIKLDDRLDKLKYPVACHTCKKQLAKGETVFFSQPEGYKFWHMRDLEDGTKCYDPLWKAAGTPYDTRKKMAIAHQLGKLDDKTLVKLALRRFRKELIIKVDQMQFKSEVYAYLKAHHLIEFDEYKNSYVIKPKGFNWDVDLGAVRMPTMDEDLMERDAEFEVKEDTL